jgi:hypothetical protein
MPWGAIRKKPTPRFFLIPIILKEMKKFFVALSFCMALIAPSMAQDSITPPNWTKGGMGSLTYSEVGLFNWAAGGQSNMTLIGNLNLFANRKWTNASFDNSLDLAYGFIKNNFIFDPSAPLNKAEDKIDFNSKFGKKAWSEKVFYTGLLNFRTQFAPGLASPGAPVYVSKALAPAYLILAVGLDFKPNDKLSIFASPVSGKVTLVTDDSLAAVGSFGVNQLDENGDFRPGAGTHSRFEFGATFKAKYKADIMKNVGLETNVELFSNYIDRPQNVDVRWNNSIVARINKYLTANLITDMIYDHDVNVPIVTGKGEPVYSLNPQTNNTPFLDAGGNPIQRKGPRIQFKQVFGLGFAYKF